MKNLLEKVLKQEVSSAVLVLESTCIIDLLYSTPTFEGVFCTGYVDIGGQTVRYSQKSIPTKIEINNAFSLSFFEFIHLCKNFALEEGYSLRTEIFEAYQYEGKLYLSGCRLTNNTGETEYLNSSSEQLAVIEACKKIIEGL